MTINFNHFLALYLLAVPIFGQNGQLAVTVKDPLGNLVRSATVSISSRPIYQASADQTSVSQPRSKPITFNASTTTSALGVASFSNVPMGAYAICAALPNSQFVDTCTFAVHPPSVMVGDGKTVATTVNLIKGATLSVQVADTKQLLLAPAAVTALSPQFGLKVQVPQGPWRPLAITSVAATARQYSALVPVGMALKLMIGNSSYLLADSSGKKIPNHGARTAIDFLVPATSDSQVIKISVLGSI